MVFTIKAVEALQPGEIAWDHEISGLCARRRAGPAISFFVKYRSNDNVQRWHKLGALGTMVQTVDRRGREITRPLTIETARLEAATVLARVRVGNDPSAERAARREAMTVAELCEAYLAEVRAGTHLTRRRKPKSASTISSDGSRINAHIVPLLGRRKVVDLQPADIRAFVKAIIGMKGGTRRPTGKLRGTSRVLGGAGAATRTTGLLQGILSYAVAEEIIKTNPAWGVSRPADGQRLRRLSPDEYAKLGVAVADPLTKPALRDAVLLLALSGWRSGEVVGLRRDALDPVRRCAVLASSKTGRSVRPLARRAIEIATMQPVGDDLVFAGLGGFPKAFGRLAARVGLPADVTPHVLRHSFASEAADLGLSESTIGALLGHAKRSVTGLYIHRLDAALVASADIVADHITGLMGLGEAAGVVVELASRRAAS